MSRDEKYFSAADASPREIFKLWFYSWSQPTISFGYALKIEKIIDSEQAKKLNIELVKRITGGGMVFHQPGELTYCLLASQNLLPKGIISSCKKISELIIKGLKKAGISAVLASRDGLERFQEKICFARPTKYEVLVNNKKLVGSAQRRGKYVLLQHGSIQMDKRDPIFDRLLDCQGLDQSQISINELVKKPLRYKELAEILGDEFLYNYAGEKLRR